jgi:hypothetical protein
MSSAEKIARAHDVRIEDELARRGIHLRGKNERFGPCPKCGGDDRFSINVAKQVFNCRGCETGGDVIDLVQHLDGVDFTSACATLIGDPSPKAKSNGNTGHASAAEPRKVKASRWFTYVDEAGATLFSVRRMEYQNPDGSFVIKDGKRKKTFEQAQPDPNKPGALLFNVDGVRLVPYRLPELIEAIGSSCTVFIVEGEYKADLLAEWNVIATCNAGGAGKWKSEHAAFLRGVNAVLLPDNDARGREHVQKVAENLKDIASRIRIVTLPDLPEKGDIVDWIKAGHTREELDALVEAAADWEPGGQSKHDIGAWKFHTGEPAAPPQSLVKGILPRCGTGLLSGQWGTFKTTVALDLSVSIMADQPFAGRYRIKRRGAVLFIALEGESMLATRLTVIAERRGVSGPLPFAWRGACPPLANENVIEALCELADEATAQFKARFDLPIVLIIIDTLIAAAQYAEGGDNDAGAAQKVMSAMSALAKHTGALVIGIDHFGKVVETGTRGSSAKEGAADTVLALLADRELNGGVKNTRLAIRKQRDGLSGFELPFIVQTVETGTDEDGDPITAQVIDWQGAAAAGRQE